MPLSSQRPMMRDSTSPGSKRVRDSSSEAATARVYFRSTGPDHDLLVHRHRMQVAEELVGAGLVEALGRDLSVLVRRAAHDTGAVGEQDVVPERVVEAPGQRR